MSGSEDDPGGIPIYPTKSDVEKAIAARAAGDDEFRTSLLANPRAALIEEIGIAFPDLVKITVLEDSLTHVHLVIPVAPMDALSEEDLELVAGGGWCWDNWQEKSDRTGRTVKWADLNRNGILDNWEYQS